MSEREYKAGYVTSVSGSKVTGVLADAANDTEATGGRSVQIGSLVKVLTPRSIAFGVVSSLQILNPSSPPAASDRRVLEVDLFGEALIADDDPEDLDGGFSFQRGVSVYPALGSAIYETTYNELSQIYARPRASNIQVGALHQDRRLPVYAITDDLLGKHFAVLGTTGSGKSCAVAVILRAVLQAHPNGHIVVLDPHNEYSHAFGDTAEVITPENLRLPHWLLNFEELVEVMCSPPGPSREAEAAILKAAVVAAKRNFIGNDEAANFITVDTPYPYQLTSLIQLIEKDMGVLEKADQSTPYLRLVARIESLRRDRRFAFMFSGLKVQDTMPEIMSRILRIPVDDKPVTIFDLSGVPSEIVDVVVSLLCRTIFDFSLWTRRDEAVPVMLVCEESHRYIPRDRSAGFEPTRKAISRIAKEGRKYGVSLCLVTQRPSELSETILSQCNTLFALRMSNDQDQDFVRKALPESALGMLNALTALRNQEAVVVGEGVTLPMRIRFNDLEENQRPLSDTAMFSLAWEDDHQPDHSLVEETIERWRHQVR